MCENILLTNFEDLSEIIHYPLKQTQRIKYTASDISQNFIIFGATSGSLYLFERDPCKFIQIIPSNNGSVAQISISNDENYVAFSTFKGTVCIVTLDIIDTCNIQVVAQNENSMATCFYWGRDSDNKKLYYGDSMGNVMLIQLSFLLGRTMLHTSIHSILLLENAIVQISGFDKLILVSTTTKCVLCNTEKEEFKQIGNKPRDGEYGACFIIPTNDNKDPGTKLKIYCARPGMRLWEVDIEGNVLQTHQLKNYLTNKLPTQVLHNNRNNDLIINNKTDLISTTSKSSSSSTPPSSSSESNDLSMIDLLLIQADDNNKVINKIPMQFSKLYSFSGKYLFAYTDNLILLFDTEHKLINLLNTQFTNIKHIHFIISKKRNNFENSDEKYLYILNKNMKLFLIKLYFLNEYLFILYIQQNYIECYNLIKNYYEYFLNIILVQKPPNNNIDVIKILKNLYEIFINLNLLNNDDNNNINILFKKLNEQNRQTINDSNSNKDDDDIDDHKNEIIIVNNKMNNIATQFKLNNKLLTTLNNSGDINSSSGTSNNDEEKIVWNLYMVYKTSKISNINFIERYTNIFDKYELKYVINLIEKLKILLHENKIGNNFKPDDDDDINMNCIKLFFDYLKIEMIWEIGDSEREYIMKSFITINNQNIINNNNHNSNFVCTECKFPLKISNVCEYKDIGLMLLQYYWSRKDYSTCFDLCSRVTYLLRIISKFYIDERDFTNIIPYCIIIGDIEILLKAIDIFDIQNWYEFYDFFNLYQLNNKKSHYYCLKCKQFCNLSKSISDESITVNNQNLSVVTQLNWNIILNLSIDCIKGGNALKLIEKYNATVTNDLVGREFYLKCLLKP